MLYDMWTESSRDGIVAVMDEMNGQRQEGPCDAGLLMNPAGDRAILRALRDARVEAVMRLHPREGHGMRETRPVAGFPGRPLAWYDRHLAATAIAAAAR
jgi:hypothetical protein